ncbi:hypothetical protein FPHYL_9091 [Fusarium phyllophilum]|uniref:Uncharacterized protein n=1 Tax=Fusarium phyllophilum TaxID=47803 RepID=A0A8H5JCN2_9HYPO|nr:hypothetical protein FPHYL_9091 [Fusarium phyllophilum]
MLQSLYVGFWGKSHVVLIPAINLGISVYLFTLRQWTTQGPLLHYARENLSTITLGVQLTSAILAASNVYAIRLATNFSRRLSVARQWISFETFVFWTLLTSGSLDFDLSAIYTALLCVGFVVQFALAPLWAAAIIPSLTEHSCSLSTVGGRFSDSSRHVWNSQFEIREPRLVWNVFSNCKSVWIGGSLYTNCPVPHLNGFLLRVAESSTSGEKPVPEFDSSGFTYRGQSYGAGTGVGIAPGIRIRDLNRAIVRNFSYTEVGYEASVQCIKNSSTMLYFVEDTDVPGNNPHMFHIKGLLPNSFEGSAEEYYPVTTWREPFENMTAWSALHNPDDNTNLLSIAAGSKKYEIFNGTQCNIRFEPRVMMVQVNVTSRSFTVEPKDGVTPADPEPSGNHTAAVVRSLNLLSRMTGHLYVSEIGEVLLSSLNGLLVNSNSSTSIEPLALTATENFLTSLVDNILSAYSISQIYIANDTYEIPIPGAFCEAVRLGSDVYIIAIMSVNTLVFFYILMTLLFNSGWRDLPDWDMKKVQDLVYGLLAGGQASHIRAPLLQNHKGNVLLEKIDHSGDSLRHSQAVNWRFRYSRAPLENDLLLNSWDESLVRD